MIIRPSGGTGALAIQPGSELTYEQDGLIRGQNVYKGDVSLLKSVPALWSAHPLEPKALCFHRRIQYGKLKTIIATLDYIGVSTDPTTYVIEFSGTLNRNPIETNPKFVQSIGGNAANPLNNAQFDGVTNLFLGFPPDADAKLGGVDSYLAPSVNARRTWWTYYTPSPANQGTIAGVFDDIIAPQGSNFLWGALTYRQVGKLFQVSQEILGSEQGGWNKTIYSTGGGDVSY